MINRRVPTILILLVMLLVGIMYWVDLTYYTDPATGFVTMGSVWARYAILLLPLLVGLLGLRTVGAKALSTLRVRSLSLSVVAALAALSGAAYGAALILLNIPSLSYGWIGLGVLFLWYGIWMLLTSRQLWRQQRVSPTHSALPGMLAALPFCALVIYRVLARPTTIYRVGPFIKNIAALFAMVWFGMLLRALYIALTRGRVRAMYIVGIVTFLLCTLELVLCVHTAVYGIFDLQALLEGVCVGAFGLLAGLVSVAAAGQGDIEPPSQRGEE